MTDIMSSTSELPSAKSISVAPTIVLQPPLSRCGNGPGLILLRPSCFSDCQQHNQSLDPEPLQKWAEESFAVAQITLDSKFSDDGASIKKLVLQAKDELLSLPECNIKDRYALIGERGSYNF